MCQCTNADSSNSLADYLPTHHICLCLSASSLREQPSIADYHRTFSSTQQCRFLTTHSQPTSILNKTLVPQSTNQAVVSLSLCVSLRATEHSRFSHKLFQAPPSTRFLTTHSQPTSILTKNPCPEMQQKPLSRSHQTKQSLYLCASLSEQPSIQHYSPRNVFKNPAVQILDNSFSTN